MNKKIALKIIYELIIFSEEQANGIYATENFDDAWKAWEYIKEKLERRTND